MGNFLKLVWFRSKTLSVIRNNFAYEVNKIAQQTFNDITRNTLHEEGNEYDAAIAFILVQLNILIENSELEPDIVRKKTTAQFIKTKLQQIDDNRSLSFGKCNDWLAEILNSESYKKLRALHA